MPNTNEHVDPIQEEFESEEAAAAFRDTHGVTDYEEFLEPVNLEVDVKRRHIEVEVDEESFKVLQETARKQRKPVKQLAGEILKQNLTRTYEVSWQRRTFRADCSCSTHDGRSRERDLYLSLSRNQDGRLTPFVWLAT